MTAHAPACCVAAAALMAASGCMLARTGVSMAVAPLGDDLAAALQEEGDLRIVEDGAPAFLLLFDGLIRSSPDNDKLLLGAAQARTAYAAAFVDPAEAARARESYGRARDYGLRVLVRANPRFGEVWDQPLDRFETAVPLFRKRDAPALYATASAWAGWIASRADAMAVADLAKVRLLMERVLALDPAGQQGGADAFFGIYYAVQPLGAGRDLDRSKAHFERAMACAGPDYLLHKVVFASSTRATGSTATSSRRRSGRSWRARSTGRSSG